MISIAVAYRNLRKAFAESLETCLNLASFKDRRFLAQGLETRSLGSHTVGLHKRTI